MMQWNDATERILETLCAEARVDLVGLFAVLRWVRSAFPHLDADASRVTTLEIVSKALDSGRVKAGSFVEAPANAFEKWKLDARDSMSRIERTWRMLGRDPDIGDNLWLFGNEVEYVVATK
jgi:hypothetical protein